MLSMFGWNQSPLWDFGNRGITGAIIGRYELQTQLPEYASLIGAKPPRRVPRWVVRLVAGAAATSTLTEGRGASNEKAKSELGWVPRYPTWREGFRAELG